MILNRIEFALMNNPVRTAVQRHCEVRQLLRMGGPLKGGHVLEIGCGRGVGTELILTHFGADSVDAFDLDPKMVALAERRFESRRLPVRFWVGDATRISARDNAYDAVFDFGIIHHIPDWRQALKEVYRVLKPGGVFYAEEVLRPVILNPVIRRLLDHPLEDRFDSGRFLKELEITGLEPIQSKDLFGAFAWFMARKKAAA